MYVSLSRFLGILETDDEFYPKKDRNQRVKDARGEASKEIEELKAKKEAEFQAFEAQVRRLPPVSFARTLSFPRSMINLGF